MCIYISCKGKRYRNMHVKLRIVHRTCNESNSTRASKLSWNVVSTLPGKCFLLGDSVFCHEYSNYRRDDETGCIIKREFPGTCLNERCQDFHVYVFHSIRIYGVSRTNIPMAETLTSLYNKRVRIYSACGLPNLIIAARIHKAIRWIW